jgi:SulP family sulfate permease
VIFLLAVLLGLGPIVAYIPNGVLAGILITVGIGIIDYKALRHIREVDRTGVVIMLVVLFLTVFVDLLVAVAVGMVMASLLFMRTMSDVVENKIKSAPLRGFSREIPWADEGDIIDQVGEKVYIKHLDGPLFFGFSSRLQQMIKALPDIEVVIIRMDKVPYVDQSGLYAMEESIQDLQDKGIRVVFTGLQGQPKDIFESLRIVPGLIPRYLCFERFEDSLPWLEEHLYTELDISTKRMRDVAENGGD